MALHDNKGYVISDIRFTPVEECPIVGNYIIRTLSKYKLERSDG